MSQSFGNKLPHDTGDSHVLARFLTGRYGALALTRAAGEAAAARRSGDDERTDLMLHVIENLRRTIVDISGDEARA